MITIKDIAEQLAQYIAKHSAERWTGRLIFTLHMRDGGIGKTEVEIKTTLPKPKPEFKKI